MNKVFGFAKETTELIIEKQSFSTVVRLNFGNVSVLGFLTNTSPSTVFCPTAPNISSGIVLFTEEYEVLDMSVEEGMKNIISMGAMSASTLIQNESD